MSQQFNIMMSEETDNSEIMGLREDINLLLMTTVGLSSEKEKKDKCNLLITKTERLKELYNNKM